MRDRSANTKAIENTLQFLRELKHRCETTKLTAVSWLTEKHSISSNTGTACKELGIVKVDNGCYGWLKGDPTREMALLILSNLLERRKPKVVVPIWPDLTAISDKIIQKLDSIAVQNEIGLKGSKGRLLGRALNQAPMNGSSLFAEVESKQSIKIDLLKSVLTGLYTGRVIGDLTPQTIDGLNLSALTVVDDVYNKFYAVK